MEVRDSDGTPRIIAKNITQGIILVSSRGRVAHTTHVVMQAVLITSSKLSSQNP